MNKPDFVFTTYPQMKHSRTRMKSGARDLVHGCDPQPWRRVVYARLTARENQMMVLVGRKMHANEARTRHFLSLYCKFTYYTYTLLPAEREHTW